MGEWATQRALEVKAMAMSKSFRFFTHIILSTPRYVKHFRCAEGDSIKLIGVCMPWCLCLVRLSSNPHR